MKRRHPRQRLRLRRESERDIAAEIRAAGLALEVIEGIQARLGQPEADLAAERAWAYAQHQTVWTQYVLANDAIRYKFWQTIRTTDLGRDLCNASVEVLRGWKQVLEGALEGLARRINACDEAFISLGRWVAAQQQPVVARG